MPARRVAATPGRKRVLACTGAALVLAFVAAGGLLIWLHTMLTGGGARTSVASQLSSALGQPVSVGSIAPMFRPRLALTLEDVRIGDPAQITIARIDVAAGLHALLSRRIEDASVHISGVRVALPLPDLRPDGSHSGAEGFELVSVREVVVSDLDIEGGDRTVRVSNLRLLDMTGAAFRLSADRVLAGAVPLEAISGQVRVTSEGIALDGVAFATLGGLGQGSAVLSQGETPRYQVRASLEGADMAATAAALGRPDTITGRLAATVDVKGQWTSADVARRTARGTARVEAADGTVRGLDFIETLSALTSRRTRPAAWDPSATNGYSRVGLTMDIADGLARTDDFLFESSAVQFTAAGTVSLDGSAVNLSGRARLPNGQAVPATVTGSVANPDVQIDGAGAALRALKTLDGEADLKGILSGLKGLLRKRR